MTCEPNDFVCKKHMVFGSEWPWPSKCIFCEYEKKEATLKAKYEKMSKALDTAVKGLHELMEPYNKEPISAKELDAINIKIAKDTLDKVRSVLSNSRKGKLAC